MSKSLGNVITPDDILGMGRDAFINTAFRLANPGDDVDLTEKTIIERYNADLANGIGNLASRTLAMIDKYFDGHIPEFHKESVNAEELQIADAASQLPQAVKDAFDQFKLAHALELIWDLIGRTDKYIANQKPWELAKDKSSQGQAALANVLAHSTGVLRTVAFTAAAFFPEKMKELLGSIGEAHSSMAGAFDLAAGFYNIKAGCKLTAIPRLFQRMELPLQPKNPAVSQASSIQSPTPGTHDKQPKTNDATNSITIEDFAKVEIRIGTVINAELVEGSTKLLKLKVSVGALGLRQILSGIREWITPEELVNRKVLIATNLAPRKMKFGVSEGMLLSAEKQPGQIEPVFVADELLEGSQLA